MADAPKVRLADYTDLTAEEEAKLEAMEQDIVHVVLNIIGSTSRPVWTVSTTEEGIRVIHLYLLDRDPPIVATIPSSELVAISSEALLMRLTGKTSR